jgi:hypothetical protein
VPTATPSVIPTALPTLTPTSLSLQYGEYFANGLTIYLNADGTFEMIYEEITYSKGPFTLDGNKISFTSVIENMCTYVGTYNWTFNGKELYLWGKDDNCDVRWSALNGGTFTLLP